MRTTTRGSRSGSPRHNDRTYLEKDKRPTGNVYGYAWRKSMPNATFEEGELEYYRRRYLKGLEARNERYTKQGHKERCKTIEELYMGEKTCPTETLFQIGNMDKHPDPELLRTCYLEYMQQIQAWNKEHGNHFHILDCAIHLDEETPHAHERSIMDVTDKYGHLIIAQEKALKEAGIELPEPDKPESRYNNRKITFDKMRRELFQDICRSHGLNITVEPRPQRMKHKSTRDYKRQQAELEAQKLKQIIRGER